MLLHHSILLFCAKACNQSKKSQLNNNNNKSSKLGNEQLAIAKCEICTVQQDSNLGEKKKKVERNIKIVTTKVKSTLP